MALFGKMRMRTPPDSCCSSCYVFCCKNEGATDNCWALCFKNQGITSCCSILWQAWERRQAAIAVAAGYLQQELECYPTTIAVVAAVIFCEEQGVRKQLLQQQQFCRAAPWRGTTRYLLWQLLGFSFKNEVATKKMLQQLLGIFVARMRAPQNSYI